MPADMQSRWLANAAINPVRSMKPICLRSSVLRIIWPLGGFLRVVHGTDGQNLVPSVGQCSYELVERKGGFCCFRIPLLLRRITRPRLLHTPAFERLLLTVRRAWNGGQSVVSLGREGRYDTESKKHGCLKTMIVASLSPGRLLARQSGLLSWRPDYQNDKRLRQKIKTHFENASKMKFLLDT
jgi:hypothetical protein